LHGGTRVRAASARWVGFFHLFFASASFRLVVRCIKVRYSFCSLTLFHARASCGCTFIQFCRAFVRRAHSRATCCTFTVLALATVAGYRQLPRPSHLYTTFFLSAGWALVLHHCGYRFVAAHVPGLPPAFSHGLPRTRFTFTLHTRSFAWFFLAPLFSLFLSTHFDASLVPHISRSAVACTFCHSSPVTTTLFHGSDSPVGSFVRFLDTWLPPVHASYLRLRASHISLHTNIHVAVQRLRFPFVRWFTAQGCLHVRAFLCTTMVCTVLWFTRFCLAQSFATGSWLPHGLRLRTLRTRTHLCRIPA